MVHEAHLTFIPLFYVEKLRDRKADLFFPLLSISLLSNLMLLPPHLLAFSKDSFYGCMDLMPQEKFSYQSLLNGIAVPFRYIMKYTTHYQ